MKFFALIYYIILWVVYIFALPFLIYKSRENKYKDSIPARFWLKNNPKFSTNNIWFHTCSFGETKAIEPLCEKLDNVVVSTTTNTGFIEAKKYKEARYLPFEIFLPFWIVRQKVLIVLEAELWFMLFFIAKIKKIPTILLNARISDNSFKNYLKFKFFYKFIFKNIDKVFAQTEIDKERLELLGAKDIEVVGNIKLAKLPKVKNRFKKEGTIFTAGSTHKNEENLILNSWYGINSKLVIVPRHPERFDEVDLLIKDFIKDKNLSYHRFSQKEDFSSDIILVDKLGILVDIYAISDLVILGGAFEKIGGHNPIEVATFGAKLISGEYIFNQKGLFEAIDGYKIVSKENLKNILQDYKNLPNTTLKKRADINYIISYINKI